MPSECAADGKFNLALYACQGQAAFEGAGQMNDNVSGWEEKKKPLHCLLFVLPLAARTLIPAGMSPVAERGPS